MADNKRKTPNVYSLQWYRFDRYVLSEGFIRPAGGTALQRYSAWSLVDGGTTRVSTAYHELLAIGRAATQEKDANNCSSRLAEAVLGWCNKYGLLGLLDHSLLSLRLAPRWRRVENRDRPSSLRPVSFHASNIGRGWQKGGDVYAGEVALAKSDEAENSLVPLSTIAGDPRMLPHAVLWGATQTEMQTLPKALGAYFPDLEASEIDGMTMLPHDEEWCRNYAEPLHDFILCAKDMYQHMQELAHPKIRGRNGRAADARLDRSFNVMELYMRRRYSAMFSAPEGIANRVAHPSLVGFLTELGWDDMLERPYIRVCADATCQLPFSSKTPLALYCSERCQNTDRRRKRKGTKRGRGRPRRDPVGAPATA